jgi:hypothetical protein
MGDIIRNTEFVDWLGEQRPFYGNFVAATQVGPPPTPSITPSNTPTPSVTPPVTPTTTVTITPTGTLTPTPTPTLPAGSTEAYAFLNQVVLTGGTVTAPMSAATITFFQGLFTNNLWNKLYAFYPFIGGTSAATAIEGKLDFPMTWNGGITFSTNGVQPNGTNGYGNTGFAPNTEITDGSPSSLGVYVNAQGSTGNRVYDAGVNDSLTLTNQLNIAVRRAAGLANQALFDVGDYDPSAFGRVSSSQGSSLGFTIGVGRSSTDRELYKNAYTIGTQTNSRALEYSTRNLFFGAQNEAGTPNYYNSNRYGFFFIGADLSESEVETMSNLVNSYQEDLSRYFYLPSGSRRNR